MTALDDHYTTLSNNKSGKETEIETKLKDEQKNNRKAQYEQEESNKVGIAGYYIGIVYYVIWIISFGFFIYDKMYKSFWSSAWILLMLFLPYLLYVYLIPYLINIFDFVFTYLIPKNAYYGITKS
jgi:hypothetical protein